MTNVPLVMGLLWDLLQLFKLMLTHRHLRLTVGQGSPDGAKRTTLQGVSLRVWADDFWLPVLSGLGEL